MNIKEENSREVNMSQQKELPKENYIYNFPAFHRASSRQIITDRIVPPKSILPPLLQYSHVS